MSLPLTRPFPAMEALLVQEIPEGNDWQYEPKWDGFRCLAFRDGRQLELQSKSGQPLTRYFPELVDALLKLEAARFVLDGEIAVSVEGVFNFDELLQRIHPAESRVLKLASAFPATYVVFDLLVGADGRPLLGLPLLIRRQALEKFSSKFLKRQARIRLSPATRELKLARKWFSEVGGDLDGIIAKRLDLPYQPGERTGMQKVKRLRTADCVVGGFRYATGAKVIGSLLLGLYDPAGLLHHVGFCSGLSTSDRRSLTPKLERLIHPPGFSGKAPGGLSRWSTRKSMEWQPLQPELVAEISYDHFTGGRFRHGTRLIRWRPDKAPRQCTMDQVAQVRKRSLELLAA